MIGTTLEKIRTHIEALASNGGSYFLLCARSGERPVPADGLRFDTRSCARVAARATEQYRAALRRYDPQLPRYDVIVSQDRLPDEGVRDDETTDGPVAVVHGHRRGPGPNADRREEYEQSDGTETDRRSRRIEFCHHVAAAVFEALSGAGHGEIESTVMDRYFQLAETVSDVDDLCLCLLESMATELSEGLAADEQTRVIEAAAGRLPAPETTAYPVATTLASLERRGMIGEYSWSPASPGSGEVVVRLSEYALSAREDRLPVLPLTVELCRHQPAAAPSSFTVDDDDGGWRIRVSRDRGDSSGELSNPRIVSRP